MLKSKKNIYTYLIVDVSHISNQNIKRETEFNSAIWLNKAIIDNEQYRQIKDKSFWKKNDSMGAGTTIKGITKLKSIKIEFQGKIRIYQTNGLNATTAMGRYGSHIRYELGSNTVVVNQKGEIITVFSNAPKTSTIPRGYYIPVKNERTLQKD